MLFNLQNNPIRETNTLLCVEELNQFKQLQKVTNLSLLFNQVSLSEVELAVSQATEHYLTAIQSDNKTAYAKIQKLSTLLDSRYDYFGSLLAQQQLTFLSLIAQHNIPITENVLTGFFYSIQPYPEFRQEMAQKEKELMVQMTHDKTLNKVQHVYLNSQQKTEKVINFIEALIHLKASIYDIKPPKISFENLGNIHGRHDEGELKFDIQTNSEMWNPDKILGLVAHEMDHYIHFMMAKGEYHAPKTHNVEDATAYLKMLYSSHEDEWVYIDATQSLQLYKASPTEQLAFENNAIWDDYNKGNLKKSIIAFDDRIQQSKSDIKQRNSFWSEIKKSHKPI